VLWHDWDPNTPIAIVRQEKGEEGGKFKPYVFSLVKPRSQKKVSELDFSEFVDKHGYKDKITNVKTNLKIPTLQDLIEWAAKQDKLKFLMLKLRVPVDEKYLIPVMVDEIKKAIDHAHPSPRFQFVILVPHKESLKLVSNQLNNSLFAFDHELPPSGITNYHRFTTVPVAMNFKNIFSSIGFHKYASTSESNLDSWTVYKFILTLDLQLRDNYKKSTSKYIKIITWTFNDEKKIKCLINLGVDGIVTDKPKMLREIALNMGKVLD
jgi:glycerophosphoryl diester phosphodiesterase